VQPETQGRSSRGAELRLNTPLLPALVALCAVEYVLTGYRGWLVVLLASAGLWLLAAWWVISLRRGLEIDRKVHLAWASAGESVPEHVKITNKSRFPAIWLEILDESDTLATPLRLVSDVVQRSTRRRNPVHQFKRRGLYTLGPTRLRTGDPFGVYTLTLHDRHSGTILVTPPQLSLSQVRISPGGGSGDRKRLSYALSREINDAGLREYVAGDSLKRISWRASAHHNELVVRQMEAAAAKDWWIFVDLEASVQAGSGQATTLELSIVLAASLAMRGLNEHRRVGLALIGPKLTWLEPRADLAHRWRILRALAMAGAGDRPLEQLLRAGNPSRTASLVVITPTALTSWVSVVGRPHRIGTITSILVDPTEFGGRGDQSRLRAALTHSRIAYLRMPGSLLEEAYAAARRDRLSGKMRLDTRTRYLAKSSSTWQSMD